MKVAWWAVTDEYSRGYGRVGSMLGGALMLAGAEMNVAQYDDQWDCRVAVSGPRAFIIDHHRHPDLLWHTMFEASPLPSTWAPLLNRCGGVWVPCQWCVDLFRDSGVIVPIYVSGYGADTRVMHPYDVPKFSRFTFLWSGTAIGTDSMGGRKGSELVIRAFRKAFADNDNVQLILKATDRSLVKHKVHTDEERREYRRRLKEGGMVSPWRMKGDERILLVTHGLTDRHYAMLHSRAHAFIYPSHGEGFGLQPLEAMACGLPVVASTYSGMGEFISNDVAITLPYHEGPARQYNNIYKEQMFWAHYNVDDICDRMLWLYEHPQEAAYIGQKAAQYVADVWTWQQAGQRGMEVLEQFMEAKHGDHQ